MKIEKHPLVSEIWNFLVDLVGPAPRFATTKSWKSGKKPKMNEKRPISPKWLF